MGLADFRARAGALTLLFLTSDQRRSTLLGLLADSLVEPRDRRVELEEEPELAEQYEDLPDPREHRPEAPVIGPDTPIRVAPAGVELLFVASVLEDWLRRSPDGPLALGELPAGTALAGLVCGWATGLLHALAAGPHSLPELNGALPAVPYRAIEEHLGRMERAGLAEAVTGAAGHTLYAATGWLREGIGPIAAAARFERHHPRDDVAPPEAIDAEAAFMLALPLLRLPEEVSGSARLAVELERGGPAGVTARFAAGQLASCVADLEPQADAWATASAVDWLDTLVEPPVARIEVGGDEHLAASLLHGLHERLFVVSAG